MNLISIGKHEIRTSGNRDFRDFPANGTPDFPSVHTQNLLVLCVLDSEKAKTTVWQPKFDIRWHYPVGVSAWAIPLLWRTPPTPGGRADVASNADSSTH